MAIPKPMAVESPDEITPIKRHALMRIIRLWLSGAYLGHSDPALLLQWQDFAETFPPDIEHYATRIKMYRLITLPKDFADRDRFMLPKQGSITGWVRSLSALDAIAADAHETFRSIKTARIGVSAMIPKLAILSTPHSMRKAAFQLAQVHDPEHNIHALRHVTFLQDFIRQRGAHHRLFEFAIQTPPRLIVHREQVYRVGRRIMRSPYGDLEHSEILALDA